MAIDFPNSPALNAYFESNGKAWTFNGTSWDIVQTPANLSIANASITGAKLASGAAVSNIGYTPANIASPTFTGTVAGITKSMVGLGSVDNTADTAKPVSTAQQTALDLKAPLAAPTFTGTVVLPSTTSIGTVSATEIGYVDGVTSAIQTQLDSKLTATTAITSNRNVIINGDMKIAQRGTSFSFPSSGGGFWWGADRFSTLDYWWTAGSNITVSQETSVVPAGFNSAYKIATGATGLTFGSGGVMRIRTFIEGFNMRAHYSKTMTLSFWVRSSIAGTYNLFLENGNWDTSTTTRAFQPEYTISAANTWEKKTITIDMASATSAGTWGTTNGIGLGITWSLGANANRTGDTYKSGWTTYSSIHSQTSTATQWATNANATFYLTGVQLEAGAVATPFEFEDYQVTLAKCQRYFWKVSGAISPNIGLSVGVGTGSTSPGIRRLTVPLPVSMRSKPTITIGGTHRLYTGGLANRGLASVNFNSSGLDRVSIDVNTENATTSGESLFWVIDSSNAIDYLDVSAEL